MSVLELKQEITRLSRREREEIHAYLIRLQHDTPQWKQATAHRIRAMQRGKAISADQLEARLGTK